MKLAAAEARRRLARPDPDRAGVLLFGADAMQVALARQALVADLVGPEGETEMRLERIAAADLRREPSLVGDAMRAKGFFPGPRVVQVDGAGDAQADAILDALAGHRPGDAALVVTAGALPARSALRKGFEAAARAFAVALYPDPPRRDEVEARLAAAGLGAVAPEGMAALMALGAALDPGEFAQTVEKLAIYAAGQPDPVGADDVAAVAPHAVEADLDEVLHLVAEGAVAALGPQLRRLAARGVAATTLAIACARHFRALHAAASASDGADAGLARMRPPVFGPRRTRMAAQARRIGQARAEKALALLTDTDLALRSPRPLPGFALVERAFIRIAMLVAR